jgi:hypothetical protein
MGIEMLEMPLMGRPAAAKRGELVSIIQEKTGFSKYKMHYSKNRKFGVLYWECRWLC